MDPSRLPDSLGWSIDDRLRHAGARKGRVLAVWQGKTLLAACAWHLHETGAAGDLRPRSALGSSGRQQRAFCTALLACLRDIAQALAGRPMNCAGVTGPSNEYPTPQQRNRYRAEIRARAEIASPGSLISTKRPQRLGFWLRILTPADSIFPSI